MLGRFVDGLFLTRPVLLVPVWGFSAFGFWRASGGSDFGSLLEGHRFATPRTFGWFVCFSAAVGCVYVVNQMADALVDRKNPGFALLAHGGVSRVTAWWSAAVCALAAVLLPVLRFPTLSLLAAVAITLGALYSFSPTRFSGRPVLDFLSNATGYGIVAFGAGWHLAGRTLSDPAFARCCAPYFLLMCGGSISSTLPDIEGDRACGKRTTAVVLGDRGAHLLAVVFIVLALVTAVLIDDAAAIICLSVAVPFYFGYVFYKARWLMEAVYKVGGAVAMVVAGVLCPPIIPAGIAVFPATILYFRLRHHVTYPRLVPTELPK